MREQLLLNVIRKNPSITYQQAAQALLVSESTIKRILRTLRTSGIIERDGSDKRGTWRVLS
ncbi:winged helix-turn-helix transcriptional regulator [Bifidobacterium hapali]|uniref:winged helix-turn-helix transcriptional regulator n=1 Tax=Bifidobacterium hapali TaxID=1630172 RepID=UPI003B830280